MIKRLQRTSLVDQVILLILLVSLGCQSQSRPATKKGGKSKTPTKISVGIVRTQRVEKKVSIPAVIESDKIARLMPRVEAYVGNVLVDIGDEVQEGQTLVQLYAPELVHAVAEHRAQLNQLLADKQVLLAELAAARTQLKVGNADLSLKTSEHTRLAKLVSSGAISRQRLEESRSAAQTSQAMLQKYTQTLHVIEAKLKKGESELAVGQAQLERTQTMAGYLEIKAPFARVVAERNVDVGNLVRPTGSSMEMQPLLTVAKVDKVRAVLFATTDIASQLAPGCATEFVTDDMPERPYQGQLSRLAGTYHEKTRMMRAEIDYSNPVDPRTGKRPLQAGNYGLATITLKSQALPVIPRAALLQDGNRQSVALVQDGFCLLVPVEVSIEVGDLLGISRGLHAGDQVVVKDARKIKNGQPLSATGFELVGW